MVSPERVVAASTVIEPARISFSADFFDDDDDSFISISPGSSMDKEQKAAEFEFLSGKNSLDLGNPTMLAADELFCDGKLLPSWKITEKLKKLNLNTTSDTKENVDKKALSVSDETSNANANRVEKLLGREPKEPRIWFVDEDPSPRPPSCTALWKELLRLKKSNRASTLSPSSSSSSTSSSSSSLGDAVDQKEATMKQRIKKGLERTRSATLRIRPMVNVPISSQTAKSTSLPPLFPLRKKKIVES